MATSNSLTDDKRSHSPLSSSLMPLYSSTETCNNDPKEETIDIMMNVMFEYIRSQCLDDKTGQQLHCISISQSIDRSTV